MLAEFFTGLLVQTILNLHNGFNTALIRGGMGAVETVGLVSGVPTAFIHSLRTINRNINSPGTPHERYTNATFQLIPPAMFMGAVVNGMGQYTQPTYQSFLNRLPIVSLPHYQDIPAYLMRLADGSIVGASVVTLPYLLYLGHRNGVYGRIGNCMRQIAVNGYNIVRNYGRTKGWW
ncbi:MAG: hypothetical protein QXO27_00400 [Candidatus Aenigmatarchaeota archaeon]